MNRYEKYVAVEWFSRDLRLAVSIQTKEKIEMQKKKKNQTTIWQKFEVLEISLMGRVLKKKLRNHSASRFLGEIISDVGRPKGDLLSKLLNKLKLCVDLIYCFQSAVLPNVYKKKRIKVNIRKFFFGSSQINPILCVCLTRKFAISWCNQVQSIIIEIRQYGAKWC